MMTSSFSPILEIEIENPTGTEASTEYTQKEKHVNDKNGTKATLEVRLRVYHQSQCNQHYAQSQHWYLASTGMTGGI